MRIKSKELFAVLFGIFLTLFYSLEGTNLYSNEMKKLLGIAIVCGIVAVLHKTTYNVKLFISLIIYIIFQFVLYNATGDTRLFISSLALLVGVNVDYQVILKGMLWTKLFSFIVVMLFVGYNHINGVALHLEILILLYISSKEEKIKRHDIFGIIFLYIISSFYTNTGSMILCGGIMVFLLIFRNNKKEEKMLYSKMTCYIFLSAMLLNIIFVMFRLITLKANIFIVNYIIDFVDEMTTSRLTLAAYSIKKFGISLIGGNIDYSKLDVGEGKYFNLDSGYMWLIQGCGIILSVVFIYLTIIMIKYLIETKKKMMIISVIVIALWAINEDILMSIGTNFGFLVMGNAINYKIRWKKENENT